MDEKVVGLIILTISLIISEILPFVSDSHKGIVHASLAGTTRVYTTLFEPSKVLPVVVAVKEVQKTENPPSEKQLAARERARVAREDYQTRIKELV